jgi:hypothetical protein
MRESRCMSLLPQTTLHSDSEHYQYWVKRNLCESSLFFGRRSTHVHKWSEMPKTAFRSNIWMKIECVTTANEVRMLRHLYPTGDTVGIILSLKCLFSIKAFGRIFSLRRSAGLHLGQWREKTFSKWRGGRGGGVQVGQSEWGADVTVKQPQPT